MKKIFIVLLVLMSYGLASAQFAAVMRNQQEERIPTKLKVINCVHAVNSSNTAWLIKVFIPRKVRIKYKFFLFSNVSVKSLVR